LLEENDWAEQKKLNASKTKLFLGFCWCLVTGKNRLKLLTNQSAKVHQKNLFRSLSHSYNLQNDLTSFIKKWNFQTFALFVNLEQTIFEQKC
jgi:hypothetical protein